MPIEIVVTPLSRVVPPGKSSTAGKFVVRLGDRVILKSSRQPLLDAARVLLADGVAPETRIAMRHEGSPHVALSATVGKAAGLTVLETETRGPELRRWKAFSRVHVAPPMRAGGDPVPDTGGEADALLGGTAAGGAP